MGGSGFIGEVVPMDKPLVVSHFVSSLATSEQLIPLILKMGFCKGNSSVCTTARSKYREKVVQLCHLFQMGGLNGMREKTLERKLVSAVKKMGGICPKFTSPGTDGMPDRIVLLPGCRIAFVEVKRHGEKPRPLQLARHEMLRRLGFKIYVLDSADQIQQILKETEGGDAE
jgi:hypothetical protein